MCICVASRSVPSTNSEYEVTDNGGALRDRFLMRRRWMRTGSASLRRVPAQRSTEFVPAHGCCVQTRYIPARAATRYASSSRTGGGVGVQKTPLSSSRI